MYEAKALDTLCKITSIEILYARMRLAWFGSAISYQLVCMCRIHLACDAELSESATCDCVVNLQLDQMNSTDRAASSQVFNEHETYIERMYSDVIDLMYIQISETMPSQRCHLLSFSISSAQSVAISVSFDL